MKFSKLTWKSFMFIEPVLLLYACGFFMSIPVQNQFIYSRYSEDVGFPYSLDSKGKDGCGNTNDVQNQTLKLLETKVQELVSGFDSLVIPCQFLPATIMGLFIVPWTDSAGRKPALLMAAFGAILEALIMIGVMYFKWPLYLFLVGKVLNALTGFFSCMVQSSFAYIFDTTDKSQISTRLAVLQLVMFTGGFLGQAFSGVFMSTFGFIRPYIFMLLLFMASFIYCLLVLPESRQPSINQDNLPSLFNVQSLKRVVSVFTAQRPSNQKRNLIVFLVINSLFFSVSLSAENLIVLHLLKSPICFSPSGLGAFSALKFACEGFGGIAGVVVLRKFLREENVYRAGFVSSSLAFLWLAYIQSQNMAFLVPIISSMSGILMPLLKGAIANLVKPEEQGATSTATSVLESLSLVFGSWIFNTLYITASEAQCSRMVFVALSVVALIPTFIISALQKSKEE